MPKLGTKGRGARGGAGATAKLSRGGRRGGCTSRTEEDDA